MCIRDRDNTVRPRLEKLIKRKKIIIPGRGDALLDYTCMENFLDCVEAAISAGPQRRFLNVSNGDPRSFKDLITAYSKHKFNLDKARHLPMLPLRIIATFFPTDRINHYSLDQMSKAMVLDLSETKRLLYWQPRQSLEECLEELWWENFRHCGLFIPHQEDSNPEQESRRFRKRGWQNTSKWFARSQGFFLDIGRASLTRIGADFL